MNKWLLIILLLQACTTWAQPAYWQQQVNYRIDVKLNDSEHTLDGFMEMEYINYSPDTLSYIWIHLWPNAFRTDKSAFSDQLLENGRTNFYFANNEERGYINRLDFRMEGKSLKTEDHPEHIDIIKLLLPKPLPPKSAVTITTPFHVLIPYNFSRGGHKDQSYQLTQWYPKAAVYDHKGWHPMPYLAQGEFYNNFGRYEVKITLPENYVVLATGDISSEAEKKWLSGRTYDAVSNTLKQLRKAAPKTASGMVVKNPVPPSSAHEKTLVFIQQNVHDFAWFADKRYVVQTDTILLSDGSTKTLYTAYTPESHTIWQHATGLMKKVMRYRTELLGEYPYTHVAAVEAFMGESGGMEYPCISSIWGCNSPAALESLLDHEIGHNWFQGMLASNERYYPWLDEGINTYYEKRYLSEVSGFNRTINKKKIAGEKLNQLLLLSLYNLRLDQPLAATAESLTPINYRLIAYEKGAAFMRLLEKQLGRERFDAAMKAYVASWKFRHPYPEDLKMALEKSSGRKLDSTFALLNRTGNFERFQKKIKIFPVFGTGDAKTNAVVIAPAAGFNFYDKVMPGISISNYTLPQTNFNFIVTPLYATASREINGIARFNYNVYPSKIFRRISFSLNAAKFNTDLFTDSAGKNYFTGIRNIVPGVKFTFNEASERSTRERYIQWRTFLIDQDVLRFRIDTSGGGRRLRINEERNQRYLNQLRFVSQNHRALYPYRYEWQLEQSKEFMRLSFTGNYFFNYRNGGGMNVRFFAGKFIYLGTRTLSTVFQTDPFHLNMTGPKGYEDYTYSNYYLGRSEFDGFLSQQIMQRDGFFKVRTDLLSSKIGKTDDWLSAINFTTDVPDVYNPLKLLPFHIPLKLFLDIGTYAEAWNNSNSSSRILFDAGFQLSLFRNLVNVYVPVIYSKVYADYFKSTYPDKRFIRNISFSIDIHQFNLRKIDRKLPFGL